MSAIEELQNLGINLKGRTSGGCKTLCPRCSHLRKKKNDPCLSVDIDSGKYKCHNSDCEFQGVARAEEIKFTVPDTNNTPLSDKNLEWFTKRGISKATILRHQITERNGNIEFNYYRMATRWPLLRSRQSRAI